MVPPRLGKLPTQQYRYLRSLYRGRHLASPRRLRWLILAGVLAVYLLHLFTGDRSIFHRMALQKELDAVTAGNIRLRVQKERLLDEVQLKENDPMSLERLAREKYWMIGPNELIYRFQDDEVVAEVRRQREEGDEDEAAEEPGSRNLPR